MPTLLLLQTVPLLLYSTTAPASVPPTVSVPDIVMPSLLLLPVSLTNATVGAATCVSSTKLSLVLPDTLPATSVCRTYTVVLPSTGVLLLLQTVPLLLYSTTAPASVPPTVSVPVFVMPSLLLLPVSLTNATVGAATCVSSTKLRLVLPDTLPATSVCRTYTVLLPSTGV